MDFVTFCSVVLDKLIAAADASPEVRAYGVSNWDLGGVVFGDVARDSANFDSTTRFDAVLGATATLHMFGLLDSADEGFTYKVSHRGRAAAQDMTVLWQSICAVEIDGAHAALLRVLNRLGANEFDDHAVLVSVDGADILADAEWTGDRDVLMGVADELERAGFLLDQSPIGMIELCPTYRSLVWQTRGKLTTDSGEIDALVEEGETPTLDLKRQLAVDTASQKAELIKDVVALANTRGAGGRYVLVGFTDEGDYYRPTDAAALAERDRLLDALDQDRLQTIVANHTAPALRIKYAEVAYQLGRVGKLEVVRDAADLPYAVSTAIGSRERGQHRVEAGQVFVRDGAVTRQARPEDIEAMKATAARARQRREQTEAGM